MAKAYDKYLLLLAVLLAGIWLFHRDPTPPAPTPAPPTANIIESVLDKAKALPDPAISGLAAFEAESLAAVKAAFGLGDYARALGLADRQLAEQSLGLSYRLWLGQQLPTLLVSQGWSLLKSAQCEDAVPLMQRALRLKAMPEANKGLAVCFAKLKAFDDADAHFRSYLHSGSDDPEMQVLYSDVLETLGRHQEASVVLEEVSKRESLPAPINRADILRRVKSMSARAGESVRQLAAVSEFYKLIYRGDEHEPLLPLVTETLDTALEEFRNQWGLILPKAPIEIILYPDAAFRNLVGNSPVWASGFYDGRIRIPVRLSMRQGAEGERLARVLRHELMHAVLAEQIDRRLVPSWFNEGIAQLVECPGSCIGVALPPLPGDFLNTSEFERKYTNLDSPSAQQAYSQSLYLVGTLQRLFGESGLRSLLEAMNSSSALDSDAILAPLGLSFDSLRQQAAYAWQQRLSADPRP